MHAQRLRQRVVIQQRSVTRSSTGDEVVTWIDRARRFAAVLPLNGKEYFAARQETADVNHRIRIRYDQSLADLDPTHRVKYGVRLFDIQSVINDRERDRELILMCRERV